MKTVMCFGTFDLVHMGHLDFFKQAKQYGEFLIVVVARDETVLKTKGKLPINNEEQRLDKISNIGIVNEVVLGDKKDVYTAIREERPEIIALGYDQKFFIDKLQEKLEEFNLDAQIVRLEAFQPEKYKSSKLKEELE